MSARLGDWLWETAPAERLVEVVQRKWRGGYVIRAIMRPDGRVHLDEGQIILAFAKASESGAALDLGVG